MSHLASRANGSIAIQNTWIEDVSVDEDRADFNSLLQEHVRRKLCTELQSIAIAIWFGGEGMHEVADRFYQRSARERSCALAIIEYFTSRKLTVELGGIDSPSSQFANQILPIGLALEDARAAQDALIRLVATAKEECEYHGEQLVRGLLADEAGAAVELNTMLTIVKRAGRSAIQIERFVSRDLRGRRSLRPAGGPFGPASTSMRKP